MKRLAYSTVNVWNVEFYLKVALHLTRFVLLPHYALTPYHVNPRRRLPFATFIYCGVKFNVYYDIILPIKNYYFNKFKFIVMWNNLYL